MPLFFSFSSAYHWEFFFSFCCHEIGTGETSRFYCGKRFIKKKKKKRICNCNTNERFLLHFNLDRTQSPYQLENTIFVMGLPTFRATGSALKTKNQTGRPRTARNSRKMWQTFEKRFRQCAGQIMDSHFY